MVLVLAGLQVIYLNLSGRNFQAIAETLGTKTEAHVRSFFISYRRRYNLDAVVREHEAESGKTHHIQAG